MTARPAAARQTGTAPGPPAARQAALTKPVVRLVVVPTGGAKAPTAGTGQFDFGTLDRMVTSRVQHTFVLRNEGHEPVTIERMQPSCGCETVILLGKRATKGALTLAPSEQAAVRVTVSLAGVFAVHTRKYVWIFARGSRVPVCNLIMGVNVLPTVLFTPRYLSFGTLASGQGKTVGLTVAVDRRLLRPGAWVLHSSDPDVVISSGRPAKSSDRRLVARVFSVTLRRIASVGRLQQTILLLDARDRTAKRGSGVSEHLPQPQYAFVSVTAEVQGKISASPAYVAFGPASPVNQVSRQVVITGDEPSLFDGSRCSAAAGYVSAHLVPTNVHPRAGRVLRTLEVALKPGRPLGPIQTYVTFIAGDGERLVLPVTGLTSNR